jgi:hypothetical protein
MVLASATVHQLPTLPASIERLYRWAPHQFRILFVSDDVLRDFIRDVETLNGDLLVLRDHLKAH